MFSLRNPEGRLGKSNNFTAFPLSGALTIFQAFSVFLRLGCFLSLPVAKHKPSLPARKSLHVLQNLRWRVH
jgi:hypothetical protein